MVTLAFIFTLFLSGTYAQDEDTTTTTTSTTATVPDIDWIDGDDPFSDTVYADMLDGFWSGMQFSSRYDNAQNCSGAIKAYFDDFHALQIVHETTEDDWEPILYEITRIISGSFADLFYNCFFMLQQIQEIAVDNDNAFIDDNDRYTSFLFNLLAKSIEIRQYSYELLYYTREGQEDWAAYVESLAGVIKCIIYFESSASSPLTLDQGSPYVEDGQGRLFLKEDIHS